MDPNQEAYVVRLFPLISTNEDIEKLTVISSTLVLRLTLQKLAMGDTIMTKRRQPEIAHR